MTEETWDNRHLTGMSLHMATREVVILCAVVGRAQSGMRCAHYAKYTYSVLNTKRPCWRVCVSPSRLVYEHTRIAHQSRPYLLSLICARSMGMDAIVCFVV